MSPALSGPNYGPAHKKLRAEWAPLVESGAVACARCGEQIAPGARWHLGHDDNDPTKYQGPEHGRCNERGGAEKRHEMKTSRNWFG